MTTTGSISSLCPVCQKKQRWKNFEFCGKTCAGKAQILCKYCRKHPKASGHEFCSKNCASLANSRDRHVKSYSLPQQTVAVDPAQLLLQAAISSPPSAPIIKRKKSLTAKLFEAAKNTIRKHSEGEDKSETTSQELAQLQMLLQSQLAPYTQVMANSQAPPPPPPKLSPASQRVCIMCRMRPARGESHFCSKQCRIQALGRAT